MRSLEELQILSQNYNLTINTMQNYTRIPIMFLRDTGLFERTYFFYEI